MLVTILTTGSRGDTQPYVALALALKSEGFSVRVAAFENYAAFVRSHGLEFHPIRGDVSQVASGDQARSARQADNPLKFILSFNKLRSLVLDLQADFFSACIGADAIVYHPGVPLGYFAAQHFGIPSILATPFPMTPTREYPALIFYNGPHLGALYNYMTHKIFQQIMWSASSSAVKRFWKEKFGRLPQSFAIPFSQQTTSRLPTIVSCSEHVFATPEDWPAHVHNTGYWFLEEEAQWEPSPDLLEFLSRGNPPVYVGFGSMGEAASAARTTEIVVQALKKSGQRGVLAKGWSGMVDTGDLAGDIFFLESAPHSWLFPRMAAVVHHGGAGTTAAGLKAGVPNIIVPYSNDQFAWGRRVQELGVGVKPIPRKNLNADGLAQAILSARDENIREAARRLGRKIAADNGAQTAAKIISDSLGR